MRRPGLLAGLIVALAAAACGGTLQVATPLAATATPTASAVTTPTPLAPPPSASASALAPVVPSAAASALPPAAPLVFRSPRYPYSITLTADWTLTAFPGTWNGVLVFAGQKGTDEYGSGSGIFEIGFLPVASGTTLSAWARTESPRATLSDCGDGPFQPPTLVGSYQVILQPGSCREADVLSAFLVHGSNGVLLQWRTVGGNATADRAAFLAILATLKLR